MTTLGLIPLETIASDAIEALLDRAFGPDRGERTAYRVRAGTLYLGALSFAAIDENAGEMAGLIQCWPVALTGSDGIRHPFIMVGPVAVEQERQGKGVGQALMRAVLDQIDAGPQIPQMMIGDPEYYERFFGFSARRTGGWRLPGPWEPRRLLARGLPETSSQEAGLLEEGSFGPWLPNDLASTRA